MSNWNDNIGWKGINLLTVRKTDRLIAVRDRERDTHRKSESLCVREIEKSTKER